MISVIAYCLVSNPSGLLCWLELTKSLSFSFGYSICSSFFLSRSFTIFSYSTGLREPHICSRMLGFLQRRPSAGEKHKGSDAPPPEPPWGNPLRRHHMQTVIICFWVLCIIAYIGAVEKAIAEHSQPTPDGAGSSFGGRGTRRRQEAVQILSFARTVLTALHVCFELRPFLARYKIPV